MAQENKSFMRKAFDYVRDIATDEASTYLGAYSGAAVAVGVGAAMACGVDMSMLKSATMVLVSALGVKAATGALLHYAFSGYDWNALT